MKSWFRSSSPPTIREVPVASFEFPSGDSYTGFPRLLKKMAMQGYPARLPPDAARNIIVVPADIMTISKADWLADRLKLLKPGNNDLLCLDLSTEATMFGPTTEFMSAQLLGFHKAVAEVGADLDRLVFLNANVASEYAHQAWCNENGVAVRPRILGFDFYFGEFQLDLQRFYAQHGLFGAVLDRSHKTVSHGARRARLFTCLNHRPRSHRYAVVLFLMSRGYLDKGFVSFAGEQSGRVDAPTVTPLAETLEFLGKLPDGAALAASVDDLLARGPLVLDRSADEIRDKLWGKDVGEIAQSLGMVHGEGLGIFDSYFEIVTETWFSDDRCQYMTEKVLRPLASLRPFVLAGPPYTLSRLRDYGFRTFAPYFNESYDDVADPVERMSMILAEIDRLCRMSPDELHGLYSELWPIMVHNYRYLWNNGLQVFRDEPLQSILNRLTS